MQRLIPPHVRRTDWYIPFWDETHLCLLELQLPPIQLLSEGLGVIRERHGQKAAGDGDLVAKPDELNPIHA